MFRNSIPILSIVIFVLSGYVLSRAGIGEHDNAFSAELDVIRPWEDNCNYYKQMNYSHYSCPNGLFDPDSVELENFRNSLYIMKLKIGSNEKEFRVSIHNTKLQCCLSVCQPVCPLLGYAELVKNVKFEIISKT